MVAKERGRGEKGSWKIRLGEGGPSMGQKENRGQILTRKKRHGKKNSIIKKEWGG